ncbi:MAG: hypothetical protein RLZZ387_904 [Chloroflexota bacterium]|jgi:integrase
MTDDTLGALVPLDPAPLAPLARAGASVDTMIAAWLHAKQGRSDSERTAKVYSATLGSFRAALQRGGLDLNSSIELVALALQGWAGSSDEKTGSAPRPATFNQRIAVVSSFYTYAQRMGMLPHNPAMRVERRKVEAYQTARPIASDVLRRKLANIKRDTLAGARDYALLSVAVTTGRRLTELAGLRWKDLHTEGDRVLLDFRRTKGGKTDRKGLKPVAARALMAWLQMFYGAELGRLDPEKPLWPALQDTGKEENKRGENTLKGRRGEALSERRMQMICQDRLGVKFHALRHTFARAMKDSGAPTDIISAQLGHSDEAITKRYLDAIDPQDNPYGDAIERLLLPE